MIRFISVLLFTCGAKSTDYCSLMCKFDSNCNRVKGSYCKHDHKPSSCFGYYFTSEAKNYVYFHSSGDARRKDLPVLCTDAHDILEPADEASPTAVTEPPSILTTETKSPPVRDYCKQLCKLDQNCSSDKHGSYVKQRRVCFGYRLDSPGSDTFMYFAKGSFKKNFPMYNDDARRIFDNILHSN